MIWILIAMAALLGVCIAITAITERSVFMGLMSAFLFWHCYYMYGHPAG